MCLYLPFSDHVTAPAVYLIPVASCWFGLHFKHAFTAGWSQSPYEAHTSRFLFNTAMAVLRTSYHKPCYISWMQLVLTNEICVYLDNTTVENLRAICLDHAKLGENSLSPTLDSRFFGPSPSQVLYLAEVCMQFNSVRLVCVFIWQNCFMRIFVTKKNPEWKFRTRRNIFTVYW